MPAGICDGALAEVPTDIQGLEAVPEIAGAPAEPTVGEADAAALIEQGETGAGRMLWEELPDGSASSPTLAGDGAALVLPQGLSAVAEEAFAGCEAVSVRIPDGATDIGARAFADCAALLCVRIPESVTAIAGDAFDGCAMDMVIRGVAGSYVLSEDVRIANSRVAIGQIDPSVTGGDAITGGYLVALTEFFTEAEENRFTTRRNVRFLMEDPTFDGSDAAAREQYDYITDYLQRTEDAIYGDGCRDGDGVSYAEYMDVDSAARYWWVQEFTANQDAFITPSTYLYKKRDGKLYWGPLWDFDKAMVEASWSANPFNNRPMPWLDHLRESDPVYQRAVGGLGGDGCRRLRHHPRGRRAGPVRGGASGLLGEKPPEMAC